MILDATTVALVTAFLAAVCAMEIFGLLGVAGAARVIRCETCGRLSPAFTTADRDAGCLRCRHAPHRHPISDQQHPSS